MKRTVYVLQTGHIICFLHKLKNVLENGEGKHIKVIKEIIDIHSEKANKKPKKVY